MTTMTAPHINDVMPAARELVAARGRVPGKDALKKELKVGYKKAGEVQAALLAENDTTTIPLAGARPLSEGAAAPASGPVEGAPRNETLPAPPALLPISLDREEGLEGRTDQGGGTPEKPSPGTGKAIPVWPIIGILIPAYVAIWGGWVDLGRMTGFGPVRILPGIRDDLVVNLAITLPIGLEVYASYAIFVWLHATASDELRRFARSSAIFSLCAGGLGQVVYHLLHAAARTTAPWPITLLVSLIPVAVLGMGAYLVHKVREGR
jgi:hypothetical protein